MSRAAAITAVRAAKARKDTRGQHKAQKAAYRATHAVLAKPPLKQRVARLLARVSGQRA
jgi:hypothetical protein